MFWVKCHLGSPGLNKDHFHYKCYNLSMLHSMTIKHVHVHQLETLYLCYWVKCPSEVIWGYWGQKDLFPKVPQLYLVLHSLTIQLSHVQPAWDPSYVLGQGNLGTFGSLGPKGYFHFKCYYSSLFYIMTWPSDLHICIFISLHRWMLYLL